MANYFVLNLDTTGPDLTIESFNNVYNNASSEITVRTDEEVVVVNDMYLIDSEGTRRDYIGAFNGLYEYNVDVDFSVYPIGAATVYVRMTDTVQNVSNLITKTINVVLAGALLIETAAYTQSKLIQANIQRAAVSIQTQKTDADTNTQSALVQASTQLTKCTVEVT